MTSPIPISAVTQYKIANIGPPIKNNSQLAWTTWYSEIPPAAYATAARKPGNYGFRRRLIVRRAAARMANIAARYRNP